MIKVKVWTIDENEEVRSIELRNLRPRRYMCGWDFERMLKYVSEELYWEDIDKDKITSISLYNEDEHWVQGIKR